MATKDDVAKLDVKITALDQRVDALDRRMDALDQKIIPKDELEEHFRAINETLIAAAEDRAEIRKKLDDVLMPAHAPNGQGEKLTTRIEAIETLIRQYGADIKALKLRLGEA